MADPQTTVENRIKVVGLLSFPHLDGKLVPAPWIKKGMYSAIILPSVSVLLDIEAEVHAVARAHWGPDRDLADLRNCLKYRDIPHKAWSIFAASAERPSLQGGNGMPERPEFFYPGQTVEMDVRLYPWSRSNPGRRSEVLEGVAAQLKGLKFLGGFVRSTE